MAFKTACAASVKALELDSIAVLVLYVSENTRVIVLLNDVFLLHKRCVKAAASRGSLFFLYFIPHLPEAAHSSPICKALALCRKITIQETRRRQGAFASVSLNLYRALQNASHSIVEPYKAMEWFSTTR